MDFCSNWYTLDIGIFALTESINEKSISATAIPVNSRSGKSTNKNKSAQQSQCCVRFTMNMQTSIWRFAMAFLLKKEAKRFWLGLKILYVYTQAVRHQEILLLLGGGMGQNTF